MLTSVNINITERPVPIFHSSEKRCLHAMIFSRVPVIKDAHVLPVPRFPDFAGRAAVSLEAIRFTHRLHIRAPEDS